MLEGKPVKEMEEWKRARELHLGLVILILVGQ
jgi:hypothetical protein